MRALRTELLGDQDSTMHAKRGILTALLLTTVIILLVVLGKHGRQERDGQHSAQVLSECPSRQNDAQTRKNLRSNAARHNATVAQQ